MNWSYANPVESWQGVSLGRSGCIVGLDLEGMNLDGWIPPELGELSRLMWLRLDGNRLSGAVPTELSAIDNLSLRVVGNDVDGAAAFGTDISSGDALANQRLLLWRLGFEKALEAPLFGHGPGALRHLDSVPAGHHGRPLGVHNLYRTLLGEAGIVPLSLFLLSVFLLLRPLWRAPKSLAPDAAAGWVVAIALYGMTFQYLLAVSAFMFMAGLSVATAAAHDDGCLGSVRA